MFRLSAALLLLAVAVPASAAVPGTADNFLQRADRLLGKGPLALFDGDYKRLQREGNDAGTSIRLEREAAEKAGKPVLYCSPKPRACARPCCWFSRTNILAGADRLSPTGVTMRSMTLVLGAGLLTFASVPAAAQSMNAEVYHSRATALMKKGPLALFSRDEIRALVEEGQKAGLKAREQRLAAVKAGGKPRFCPPEGKQSMGSDEFMKRLGAIPKAERERIDMTEALTRISAAKFPCPA